MAPNAVARLANNETYEHSDCEDAEPTTYSESIIQQSFRLNGCCCDVSRSPLPHVAESENASMSLTEMVEYYTDTCNIADVIGLVQSNKRLPMFPPRSTDNTMWRSALAGLLPDSETRLGLSLQKSCYAPRPRIQIHRLWDIDFFAIPHSLGAFKDSLKITYITKYNRTISQDWHLNLTAYRLRPTKHYHLFFGYSLASADFKCYIFFPHMRTPQRRRNKERFLLPFNKQMVWVDRVLLPAIRLIFSGDLLQYHPRSWAEALSRSQARQRENVKQSSRVFAEHFYDLPYREGIFEQFEEEIRRNVRNLDAEWQEPQIVSTMYDCKNIFRATGIAKLREKIWDGLQDRFNTESLVLDQIWADLAYSDSAIHPAQPDHAYVLVRKSICNLEDMRTLDLEKRCQIYGWHGTAEAGAIRATPTLQSALRRGGVAYVQAYNVSKNMFASIDRSISALFGEPAFCLLGYSDATLREF